MWPSGNNVIDWISKVKDHGLEFASNRYYSTYKGKVESTKDLQQQGRIRVSVPELGLIRTKDGATKGETLALEAYPNAQFAGENYGMYFPPYEGDSVWVWFEYGNPTQPNYSGARWLNKGSNNDGTGAKTGATSQVPFEFINSSTGIPTRRGIKTKYGHGLMFEDDPKSVGGARIEIWTGENVGVRQAALKHHSFNMTDDPAKPRVELITFKKNSTTWDDTPATQGIRSQTIYGLKIKQDDVLKEILIETPLKHKIKISDLGPDNISFTTALGQTASFSDTTQSITVNTLGTVNVAAGLAANVTVGGAATITAAGLVGITGNGITLNSSGAGPMVSLASGVTSNNFIGAVTENYAGVLNQTILGVWNATTGAFNLISGVVSLGSPGTKYFLVDQRFFTIFNTHTHTAPALGGVTTPPDAPYQIGGAVPINAVSSQSVTAN